MGRGYRAPTNYDPHRSPKRKQRPGAAARGSAASGEAGAARRHNSAASLSRQDHRARSAAAAPERTTTPHETGYTNPKRIPTDRVYPPLAAQQITAKQAEGVSFHDLGLGPRIIRELAKQNAQVPYPLQVATIPDALAGRNVLGRGRTGSGKTIAFGAALVERLFAVRGSRNRGPARPPQALVLAPTRELAVQIDRTIQPFARALGLFTTQLYGGVPASQQREGLRRGVDIVIGTPGRIDDLAERGSLDLSQVIITVLDEADIMSEMGFVEQVNRILHRTRPTGQRMLFSATLDAQVRGLVERYLPNPAVHEVADDHAAINHRLRLVPRGEKEAVAARLAATAGKILVFVRTRAGVDALVASLTQANITALPLHGDLTQAARLANLRQFSQGHTPVLVATDVAARGIHVDDISLVVQFDPPLDHKTYVHRAGRTGRGDARGTVVTLVTSAQLEPVRELLAHAGVTPTIDR